MSHQKLHVCLCCPSDCSCLQQTHGCQGKPGKLDFQWLCAPHRLNHLQVLISLTSETLWLPVWAKVIKNGFWFGRNSQLLRVLVFFFFLVFPSFLQEHMIYYTYLFKWKRKFLSISLLKYKLNKPCLLLEYLRLRNNTVIDITYDKAKPERSGRRFKKCLKCPQSTRNLGT